MQIEPQGYFQTELQYVLSPQCKKVGFILYAYESIFSSSLEGERRNIKEDSGFAFEGTIDLGLK